ncbi:hypothetical protein [Litoribrevibacter albus]|uniref:Uncharacterized protein n=1 Tax=Litoribrevibacter albus TaxID=1473156 RepID=A0AA37SBU6_9GAMM|nr:hypothetical protein [Litoribrevibacter albus]GLQ31667.1 hypothetical protein GCM10007876_21460 [Litoribrevibacter albus]
MAQFPNVEWGGVTVAHVQPAVTNKSLSGKRQSLIREVSYWTIEFTTRNYEYDDLRAVQAFINSLDGMYQPFDVVVPQVSYKRGVASIANGYSNVEVSSVTDSKTVVLRRLKANVEDCFKAGDLIRFANHSKVYQITESVTSSASGTATVKLHTALHVSDITTGTIVIIDAVPFTVQLQRDTQEFSLKPGLITRVQVNCIEVV